MKSDFLALGSPLGLLLDLPFISTKIGSLGLLFGLKLCLLSGGNIQKYDVYWLKYS